MALIGDTTGLARLEYVTEFGELKAMLPSKEGYSITLPDGTVGSSISGGLEKQQRQFFNAPTIVSCTYRLKKIDGQWLDTFLRDNNGENFIAWLYDDQNIEEYIVQIVSSSRPRKNSDGHSLTEISVTYKLQPNIYDPDFIDARLSLGALGSSVVFDELEAMANPDFEF